MLIETISPFLAKTIVGKCIIQLSDIYNATLYIYVHLCTKKTLMEVKSLILLQTICHILFHLPVCPSRYVCPAIYLSIHIAICLSIHLHICHLSVHPPICVSHLTALGCWGMQHSCCLEHSVVGYMIKAALLTCNTSLVASLFALVFDALKISKLRRNTNHFKNEKLRKFCYVMVVYGIHCHLLPQIVYSIV